MHGEQQCKSKVICAVTPHLHPRSNIKSEQVKKRRQTVF